MRKPAEDQDMSQSQRWALSPEERRELHRIYDDHEHWERTVGRDRRRALAERLEEWRKTSADAPVRSAEERRAVSEFFEDHERWEKAQARARRRALAQRAGR